MSRWTGRAFKGARQTLRAMKRTEAGRRNAATPDERRRRTRRNTAAAAGTDR